MSNVSKHQFNGKEEANLPKQQSNVKGEDMPNLSTNGKEENIPNQTNAQPQGCFENCNQLNDYNGQTSEPPIKKPKLNVQTQ